MSESCLQVELKIADELDSPPSGPSCSGSPASPTTRRTRASFYAIKHVRSRRIVGCSRNSRMTTDLAVAALRKVETLCAPVGTALHSD